jgi:hypothetical protein
MGTNEKLHSLSFYAKPMKTTPTHRKMEENLLALPTEAKNGYCI